MIFISLNILSIIVLILGLLLITESKSSSTAPIGIIIVFGGSLVLLSSYFINDEYIQSFATKQAILQQDIIINQIGNKTVEIELYKLEINKKDTIRYYQIKKDSL